MNISVVMATYNGEKFLSEQLDTIIKQTRLPDEVLISDDGSSDDTITIVEKYIAKNELEDKWKVRINEKNKGYAKNFLDAALSATGDIIFFCDQDDLWVCDRLEVMSSIMEKNKNIKLLCSNLTPFYYEKDTRIWDPRDLATMTNDGNLEHHSLDAKNFHLKRSGCTMCVRKKFLKEIIPYWTQGWAHDDFVWKMAVIDDSCAIIQYNSMKRRMHSSNASVIRIRTREWRIEQLKGFVNQCDSMMRYAEQKNIENSKLEVIRKNRKAIELRLDVVEKKEIWKWVILYMKYKDCYPRIKGIYLDLYITLFNQYKGAN